MEEEGSIFCLGSLVHNEIVISNLVKKGMKIINSIDEAPDGVKVIFRAHGESVEVYERAREKNIDVIDLTCGRVRIIHDKVLRQANDSFIIIIGKKKHPEVIGTKSFADFNSIVIEDENDIEDAYQLYRKSNLKKVYICSQTTFREILFEELVKKIQDKFIDADILIDNTICLSTVNRQKEVNELSSKVDKVIVIGDKLSSNTKELYNIAKNNCELVYLISSCEELLDIRFNDDDMVGIISGASTSIDTINLVINTLKDKI